MAEIRIEHKKHRPVWPWIIAILLLAGVAWWIVDSDDREESVVAYTENETEQIEEQQVANRAYEDNAMSPVNEYVRFVEEDMDNADLGEDHQFTSEGIQKLSAALVVLAEQKGAGDAAISQKVDDFRQNAQQLQENSESLKHANMIQQTFSQAADLMASIKEKSFPNEDIEINKVQDAANQIKADKPALEQKEEIKNFFEESSEALEAMSKKKK